MQLLLFLLIALAKVGMSKAATCNADADCTTADSPKCITGTCKCPGSTGWLMDGNVCYYPCSGICSNVPIVPQPDMNALACKNKHCVCADGYEGLINNCTDVDECNLNPTLCENGGTCTNKAPGFTCACVKGFDGATCHNNIDDCPTGPTDACFNGGTCVDQIDGYICTCPKGYTGKVCDTKTGSDSGVAALSTSVVVVIACAVAVALFL